MKQRIISLIVAAFFIAAMVTPASQAFADPAQEPTPNPGAVYTTVEDDSVQNANVHEYDLRTDVYIRVNDDLAGKTCLIQVTNPSGRVLLGESSKPVTFEAGKVYRVWDYVYYTAYDDSGNPEIIDGFDFTPNPGGEYKVWVFLDNDSVEKPSWKTDNFKVDERPQVEYSPAIAITKTAVETDEPSDEYIAEAEKETETEAENLITEAKTGDLITYKYVVTNTGNVKLTDINVHDIPLGDISLEGQEDNDLDVGETMTLYKEYTVLEDDPDPLTNVVTATGYFKGEALTATDDWSIDLIKASIDLVKTANVSTAKTNDTITYTYTITNTGDLPLTNITLSDDKLGNIALQTNSLAEKGDYTTATAIHVVNRNDSDPLKNVATVTAASGNGSVSDTAEATVDLIFPTITVKPDLEITKAADKGTVSPGDELEYTITVHNKGDAAANGVKVYETLPAFTSPVDGKNAGWNLESGKYVYDLGSLAIGETRTLKFVVRVESPFTGSVKKVINEVEVKDNGAETNTGDNKATVETPVTVPVPPVFPDLKVTKTDNDRTAKPGDEVEYVITVENIGSAAAAEVKVYENLPQGASFVTEKSDDWVLEDGKYVYAIGQLDAGAVKELKFVVKVDESISDEQNELINTVEVKDDGSDSDTSNNTAEERTPVETVPEETVPEETVTVTVTPEEDVPDLPYTGGLVEPEMLAGGLGLILVLTGEVLNRKRKK